jgi:hypothetical protein
MDRGRGAVSFAMSILVSMGVDRAPIGLDRHFLETCRPQGKGKGKGVPPALFDL